MPEGETIRQILQSASLVSIRRELRGLCRGRTRLCATVYVFVRTDACKMVSGCHVVLVELTDALAVVIASDGFSEQAARIKDV